MTENRRRKQRCGEPHGPSRQARRYGGESPRRRPPAKPAPRWYRTRGRKRPAPSPPAPSPGSNATASPSHAWCRQGQRLQEPCLPRPSHRVHIRHIRIGPTCPRTNGKAERFIQTSLREWPMRSHTFVNRPKRRHATMDRHLQHKATPLSPRRVIHFLSFIHCAAAMIWMR
jgi:hypothetical protein